MTRALAVLQALGRPVLLLSDPADFTAVGIFLSPGPRGLWGVEFPNRTRLDVDEVGATVFLPSGAQLVAAPVGRGAWALAVVDDAREAAGVGARVLVGRRLQLAGAKEQRR